MKVEVEHVCGHSAHHECAKRWMPEYLAKKACPACQNAKDARFAATLGLPELVGTPKQVAWANTIRLKHARSTDPGTLSRLRLADSASWWIDHKNDSMTTVLADIANLSQETIDDLVQSWDRGRA